MIYLNDNARTLKTEAVPRSDDVLAAIRAHRRNQSPIPERTQHRRNEFLHFIPAEPRYAILGAFERQLIHRVIRVRFTLAGRGAGDIRYGLTGSGNAAHYRSGFVGQQE